MALILIVVVCVIAGVYLGSYLADRRERKAAEVQSSPAPSAPAQPTARRRWFGASKQPDQALQFQNWASAHLQNADLRRWIAGLSKEQIQALTEHLTAFCSNLGFDLDWLTSQRLASSPELEPTAATIIEHYCMACFQATTVQSDFQHFRQALDLIEQPFSREHKPITQKLYTELVRRNVVPPMSAEHMLANEQERQAEIARVLKETARSNWAAFMAAFAEVSRSEQPQHKGGLTASLRNTFRLREVTFPAGRKTTAAPEAPAADLNAQAAVPSE